MKQGIKTMGCKAISSFMMGLFALFLFPQTAFAYTLPETEGASNSITTSSSFTVDKAGIYKIDCYGGGGGGCNAVSYAECGFAGYSRGDDFTNDAWSRGGTGGKAYGYVNLKKGDAVEVVVGNGGASGYQRNTGSGWGSDGVTVDTYAYGSAGGDSYVTINGVRVMTGGHGGGSKTWAHAFLGQDGEHNGSVIFNGDSSLAGAFYGAASPRQAFGYRSDTSQGYKWGNGYTSSYPECLNGDCYINTSVVKAFNSTTGKLENIADTSSYLQYGAGGVGGTSRNAGSKGSVAVTAIKLDITVSFDYSANGGTSMDTSGYTLPTDIVNAGGVSTKDESGVYSYVFTSDYDGVAIGNIGALKGVKSGYTFVGWNTNRDAITGMNLSNGTVAGATYYAIYKRTVDAVYHDYDGKTARINSIGSAVIYNNQTDFSVAVPTAKALTDYDNYTWDLYGWTYDISGHTIYNSAGTIPLRTSMFEKNLGVELKDSNGNSYIDIYAVYQFPVTMTYHPNNNTFTGNTGENEIIQTAYRYFNSVYSYDRKSVYENPTINLKAASILTNSANFEKWKIFNTSDRNVYKTRIIGNHNKYAEVIPASTDLLVAQPNVTATYVTAGTDYGINSSITMDRDMDAWGIYYIYNIMVDDETAMKVDLDTTSKIKTVYSDGKMIFNGKLN